MKKTKKQYNEHKHMNERQDNDTNIFTNKHKWMKRKR